MSLCRRFTSLFCLALLGASAFTCTSKESTRSQGSAGGAEEAPPAAPSDTPPTDGARATVVVIPSDEFASIVEPQSVAATNLIEAQLVISRFEIGTGAATEVQRVALDGGRISVPMAEGVYAFKFLSLEGIVGVRAIDAAGTRTLVSVIDRRAGPQARALTAEVMKQPHANLNAPIGPTILTLADSLRYLPASLLDAPDWRTRLATLIVEKSNNHPDPGAGNPLDLAKVDELLKSGTYTAWGALPKGPVSALVDDIVQAASAEANPTLAALRKAVEAAKTVARLPATIPAAEREDTGRAIASDNAPPTAGTLSAAMDVSATEFTLQWTAGADNLTRAADLRYLVCSGATAEAVATVAACMTATIEQDFAANLTTIALKGRSPGTVYHVNVVVSDVAGNKTLYGGISVTAKSATANVKIAAPAAGTAAFVGSALTATWTTTPAGLPCDVEISADGGATWKTLATALAATTLSIGIDTAAPASARLRVKATGDATAADTVAFDVPTPVIEMQYPLNSVTTVTAGSTVNAAWSALNLAGAVDLLVSTDNGTSWATLIAGTANDGAETVTMPGTPTAFARLRVRSATQPAFAATSAASFVIAASPTLFLTVPAGGSALLPGEVVTITWTSSGLPATAAIGLSVDGGATWSAISASTANDGAFEWTVPNQATATGRIRVTSGDLTAQNSPHFSIASPALSLTAPASGANFPTGSHLVTWAGSNFAGAVKLEISSDNGATWTTAVAQTPNDGSESISFPNASAQTRVRVTAVRAPGLSATSAAFTVNGTRAITVTAPASGATLARESRYEIKWTSVGNIPNVLIEYDDGTTTATLGTVPNAGHFEWTVPNTATSNGRILVSDATDYAIIGTSTGVFTTATGPWFDLVFPRAGDVCNTAARCTVRWNLNGAGFGPFVDIMFSTDGGATYPDTLASGVPISQTDADLVMPTATATGRIKVVQQGSPDTFATSGGDFYVTGTASAGAVTDATPLGAATCAGSEQTVALTSGRNHQVLASWLSASPTKHTTRLYNGMDWGSQTYSLAAAGTVPYFFGRLVSAFLDQTSDAVVATAVERNGTDTIRLLFDADAANGTNFVVEPLDLDTQDDVTLKIAAHRGKAVVAWIDTDTSPAQIKTRVFDGTSWAASTNLSGGAGVAEFNAALHLVSKPGASGPLRVVAGWVSGDSQRYSFRVFDGTSWSAEIFQDVGSFINDFAIDVDDFGNVAIIYTQDAPAGVFLSYYDVATTSWIYAPYTIDSMGVGWIDGVGITMSPNGKYLALSYLKHALSPPVIMRGLALGRDFRDPYSLQVGMPTQLESAADIQVDEHRGHIGISDTGTAVVAYSRRANLGDPEAEVHYSTFHWPTQAWSTGTFAQQPTSNPLCGGVSVKFDAFQAYGAKAAIGSVGADGNAQVSIFSAP